MATAKTNGTTARAPICRRNRAWDDRTATGSSTSAEKGMNVSTSMPVR
jgi:hypothetical protein